MVATSAKTGAGIDELRECLEQRRLELKQSGELVRRRRLAACHWVTERLREEFGLFGLDCLQAGATVEEQLLTSTQSLPGMLDSMRGQILGALADGAALKLHHDAGLNKQAKKS